MNPIESTRLKNQNDLDELDENAGTWNILCHL
jgi:hypothetical protein